MSPTPQPEIDQDDLAAIDEAIGQVLDAEAHRLALHEHIDGKIALDKVLWGKAVELGWPALGLPKDFDGLGFGVRGLDLLHRQLGRHVAPGSFLASLTAAQVISEVGDDDVKAKWLPGLASGETRLAIAARIGTTPGGEGSWLLGDADCDAAMVPLSDDEWGLVGIASPDVAEMWDRTRTMLTVDLAECNVLAPLPGPATKQSLARNFSLAVASDSIGATRAILEITVDYMKEREQFGRPIASFQALKHRVADHMTEVVSGEEFVALAVDSAASGNPDADVWAKLAKTRCTESFLRITQDCLQLHGGVGFTWEYDVHMYLNRARLSELLVAPNTKLKDEAAAGFADAIRSGRQPLELA